MHPETRKSIKIDIENRYFKDLEMCYYEIFVDYADQDTWANSYEWDIDFQALTSVDAVLSVGPNLTAASNTTVVEAG